MNLALTLNCWQDADLIFAQQLGVTHVVADGPAMALRWKEAELSALHNRVRQAGLTLAAVDGLPSAGCWKPGAMTAELLAATARARMAVEAAGRAGVPVVVYSLGGEGIGASADEAQLVDEERLVQPLGGVLPVAEASGVRLACRLDGGEHQTARESGPTLRGLDLLDRLIHLAPSASHGVDLQPGLLAGETDSRRAVDLRRLVEQGRLLLASVGTPSSPLGARDRGPRVDRHDCPAPSGPELTEPVGMLPLLRALRDAGFTGPVRPARALGISGDTDWGHRGYAHQLGYLRAVLQALERGIAQ